MNLEFYTDKSTGLCDVTFSTPEEELMRMFLTAVNSQMRFKIIRKLIKKEKGSYFLGEYLTFKVKKDKCFIVDDFDLDLGIEELKVKSKEILKLLAEWEEFLEQHNKLPEK